MKELTIKNEESYFGVEELFFSRTDKRGVIQSANSVFTRVSKHGWDGLFNKAHNVIRHPNIPKGVFYLFWDILKQNKSVGAYVLNRACDGSYYYVFSVAVPLEETGGYVSVRLKPTTEIKDVVLKLYEKLLNLEHTNKLTPEHSSKIILEEINSLGFISYEEFMVDALVKECISRCEALGNKRSFGFKALLELVKLSKELNQESKNIFENYKKIQHTPLNLNIIAENLKKRWKNNFSYIR